jgi:hypothetical protein
MSMNPNYLLREELEYDVHFLRKIFALLSLKLFVPIRPEILGKVEPRELVVVISL